MNIFGRICIWLYIVGLARGFKCKYCRDTGDGGNPICQDVDPSSGNPVECDDDGSCQCSVRWKDDIPTFFSSCEPTLSVTNETCIFGEKRFNQRSDKCYCDSDDCNPCAKVQYKRPEAEDISCRVCAGTNQQCNGGNDVGTSEKCSGANACLLETKVAPGKGQEPEMTYFRRCSGKAVLENICTEKELTIAGAKHTTTNCYCTSNNCNGKTDPPPTGDNNIGFTTQEDAKVMVAVLMPVCLSLML